MTRFYMNDQLWTVEFVSPDDPMLVDRTNRLTVATTDPVSHTVRISNLLRGDFLIVVLIHELGHCALFSYNLIRKIHSMTYPEYWIDIEELFCNFIAEYGQTIFKNAFKILGYNALSVIPDEMDKIFA